MDPDAPLSFEQLFLLRKIQIGDIAGENAIALADQLVAHGYLQSKKGRLRLTRKGKDLLSPNAHGGGGIRWAIACKYFDHLDHSDFCDLVSGGRLQEYMEHQALARGLGACTQPGYGASRRG